MGGSAENDFACNRGRVGRRNWGSRNRFVATVVPQCCGWLLINEGEADQAKSYLAGIPTAPHVPSSASGFPLSGIGQIVVDYRFETAVDNNGQTLIPPTLREFAT